MSRLALSLLVLTVFLLLVALMWWGWRNRARRHAALPAFPAVPDGLLDTAAERATLSSTGVYASTVTGASWQDRVAVGDVGFRADATAYLLPDGVLFDRVGASPLWIPAAALVAARTEAGIAGKVMGAGGLLVIRWRIDDHERGSHEFDTGFRADDKTDYDVWAPAVRALIAQENLEVPHGE